MSYTALYRKKRPKTFAEMVGQQHIVRALNNQLVTKHVSHAYLFCGTRGTGKTSAAKILARAVNCISPQNGEPCNVCEMCINILKERCMDVAEIDAASNNGVENIRDLREEVKYPPTQGRYKVYIIDEVHMLSASAFNALLKTLEEPPAHVIFILATTDPQKIPDTILSRCQRYDFRRISVVDMVSTLKKYLADEGVTFEETALDYIAYHSDGAMRDALSLLDQCISLGDDDGLTYEKVLDILGAVDRVRLFEFTDALAAKDSKGIMAIIDTAMKDGRDVSQFAADLIRHFRDVLVATLADNVNDLDFSAEIAAKLKEQGDKISCAELMEYIHAFSETLREMRFAPHIRTAFEVCALGLCMPRQVVQAAAQPLGEGGAVAVGQPSVQQGAGMLLAEQTSGVQSSENEPADEQVNSDLPISTEPSSTITPEILNAIVSSWHALCKGLPLPLRMWCANAGVEINDGVLQIVCDNEASIALIKKQQTTIREKIADKYNLSTPPNLAFVVKEAYNKKAAVKPPPSSSPPPEEMPMQTPPDDWADFGTQVSESTTPAATDDDWAAFGQPMIGSDESNSDNPF